MEGREAEILRKCTACIGCNDHCPVGAHPSNLIFRMQEERGLSPIVAVGAPLPDHIDKGLEGRGECIKDAIGSCSDALVTVCPVWGWVLQSTPPRNGLSKIFD